MTLHHLVQSLGWWTPVEIAGFLVAGFALGFAHFATLWRHARELVEGSGWWRTAILAAGRFSLLIAALTLASFQGAAALLAMTLGLLFGRAVVMRRWGRIQP